MNRTILYIRSTSMYYDSRATKEIKVFLENGYNVYIVGWDREGNALEKCKEVFGTKNVKYFFFDVKVEKRIGIKNVGLMYQWLNFVKKVYLDNKDDIDIVHGCNLDTCILFYRRLKKDGTKYVHDMFDYYKDARNLTGILGYIVEKIETDVVNRADITIICTEARKEQIAKTKPKKLIIIHNSPEVEVDVVEDNIMDYFYCGTLCEARLIGETLDEYKNYDFLKVGFAGFGVFQDLAEKNAKIFKNFSYFGRIPYSDCLKYEAQSLCLSAIYEPTWRNHRLCAPNKFYESLALGKPIIVCKGTGIDQIVEEYKIGFSINYSAKELYDSVIWLKKHEEERTEMGRRARMLYEQKYSWRIMKKILIDAYDGLTGVKHD